MATTPDRGNPPLSVQARLQEFFRRLEETPPAPSESEAWLLVVGILDEVEDQYSGVPKNPHPGLRFDGRMYPPQDDHIDRAPDGALTGWTRGHIIEIGFDGHIVIRERASRQVVLEKSGGGSPV